MTDAVSIQEALKRREGTTVTANLQHMKFNQVRFNLSQEDRCRMTKYLFSS